MKNNGLLLVFSTALLSGFSVFINKYGVALTNPYVFAFLKNSLVALLLTSLLLTIKEFASLRQLNAKNWGKLLLIGLIGGAIPFLLFFKGLAMTTASQGSFIQKTMFVYVALLAIIFLKEKISKSFLVGAGLLLAANVLLLKSFHFSFGVGDLLILAATLFWAVENVLAKYALKELSGNVVAWGRMFFGSLFIAGFLAATGQLTLIATLTFSQIGWVVITSILLFGYVFTWYNGLKHLPVSLATVILMLGSPITILLTAIASHKISGTEVFSGLLMVFGIVFIIGFFRSSKKSEFSKINF